MHRERVVRDLATVPIQALLDCYPAPAALVDARGDIIGVNEAWTEDARERGADLPAVGIGVNYFEVLQRASGDEGAAEMQGELRRVLAGSLRHATVPYSCAWQGGKTWHVARTCALDTESHERLALIGHHDVSALVQSEDQRRQLRQTLQQAEATGNRILEVVSHELRTPLTTVRGNADILARRRAELSAEQRQKALEDIRHDAERLRFTIENMIAMAQTDDSLGAEPEPLLLPRMLGKAAREHLLLYRERPVATAYPEALPPVLARESDVRLILLNLFSNASRYSDPGPPLDVMVEQQGGHVLTTVLDDGIGIPPDELHRVTEPFFRCANVTKRDSGVGVGLTVCQRLLDRAGGSLHVQNRAGGGVAASFSLPIAQEHLG